MPAFAFADLLLEAADGSVGVFAAFTQVDCVFPFPLGAAAIVDVAVHDPLETTTLEHFHTFHHDCVMREREN